MKKIRSISCLMLVFVIAASINVSAATRPARGGKKEADSNRVYDFETEEYVVHDDIFEGTQTVFAVMPEGYENYPTEHKGTIEKLFYETDVYEDGVTYQKYVTVYLPYGYDQDDKEKKYNVLYFQHGNQNSPNQLWERYTQGMIPKQMVDNLFDPDHQAMEPFIIISPTYYFDLNEKTKFIADGSIPAGDGRYEGIPGNYYKEIVEDLIPQIESRYNVYCEDFSPEGIKASRDHRAFCGYSRGSVCTWNIIHNDFEYFKYFMPMSANICPENMVLGNGIDYFSPEEAFEYINETVTANSDLDFFIFATSGGEEDGAGQNMIPQLQQFYAHPETYSYGTDTGVNNFCFAVSEFSHTDQVVPHSWYVFKDVLFK
ncbi:MAG: hypothetical protein HUJ76_00915 [Parasporobacterium sp.]|nr:hypothetical protein [Parasporobacterium sp.]